MANDTPDLIRKLEPRDRAAVRDICCRTAFRNAGSDKFFEDREIHADYWTSYYTDYHPQESWVIERGTEVIGYFFGASDYDHFFRTMSRKIVPKGAAKALWRLALGRYKQPLPRAVSLQHPAQGLRARLLQPACADVSGSSGCHRRDRPAWYDYRTGGQRGHLAQV